MKRELEFPFPAEHMTLNRRAHWREVKRLHDAWFDATLIHARRTKWRDLPPSDVQVHYTGIMVTDPENMALVTKWIVDALATRPKPPHGAGFWPDDDDRWVTVQPNTVDRHRWPIHRRTVTVTITDRKKD